MFVRFVWELRFSGLSVALRIEGRWSSSGEQVAIIHNEARGLGKWRGRVCAFNSNCRLRICWRLNGA